MSVENCNNEDRECRDALIKEMNDEISVACQIPFTVPRKELGRIIEKAKKYFYKIYEDSVEEMYLGLPGKTFKTNEFKKGITNTEQELSIDHTQSTRGVVLMPPNVFSVIGVFEIGGFSGEDGGSGGSSSFSYGDSNFSDQKFLYSNTYQYGTGIASDNLVYYVINEKFLDNSRQILQQEISFSFNRLTKKFRFQGELPKDSVIFKVMATIPDCDLFQDEAFIRYCTAKAKMQLSRIMGTFNYNLPGNITINYDMIQSEGREELESVVEEIKGDEGVDYFFTS